MKKRCTIIVYILLCFLSCFAQRIDNYWLFGYDYNCQGCPNYGAAYIEFDTTGIINIDTSNREMDFSCPTSVSISNKQGEILFYSNGYAIMDRNNDTLIHGDSLYHTPLALAAINDGMQVMQSMIILPSVIDTSIYYFLHSTVLEISDPIYTARGLNLYISTINKQLNNGLGDVTTKNEILISDTLSLGGLTAVKHANGRDWWIVMPGMWEDEYHISLLTPNGFGIPTVQKVVGLSHIKAGNTYQSFFSRSGSKYFRQDGESSRIYILDFDRCSGLFNNPKIIPMVFSVGLSVSPNEKILYFVEAGTDVFQYDLEAADIPASKLHIATWDGTGGIYGGLSLMYLAPDDKIYFVSQRAYLHKIEYPDVWGVGCQVMQHCIALPKINGRTIPNYPNFYLGALSGSACDTLTSHQAPINHTAIKLYPNPANEILSIEIPEIKAPLICIFYNLMGQKVHEQTLSQPITHIKVGDWQKGAYFYEIVRDNDRINGKVFIQ